MDWEGGRDIQITDKKQINTLSSKLIKYFFWLSIPYIDMFVLADTQHIIVIGYDKCVYWHIRTLESMNAAASLVVPELQYSIVAWTYYYAIGKKRKPGDVGGVQYW